MLTEKEELKGIRTSAYSPILWKRYVDDKIVVIKSAFKNEFLDNIITVDQCIQFTLENTRADVFLPFLDMLIMPKHLQKVLLRCKYPMLPLNRTKIKNCVQPNPDSNSSGTNQQHNAKTVPNKKTYILVPYTKGLSDSFMNMCRKHGFKYFWRGNTI